MVSMRGRLDEQSTDDLKSDEVWLVDLPRPETRPLTIGQASKIVLFDHRFFSTFRDSYFRMDEANQEPAFVVRVSDNEMVLPFEGMMREFSIEPGSADGRMLELVAESLAYVNFIRLGDIVPKEVVTGDASWEVPEQIRQRAYGRLAVGLVSWLSGYAVQFSTTDDIERLLEKPQMRDSINRAFAQAAEELGYGSDNRVKVMERFEEVAQEVARLDVLRLRFDGIRMVHDKVKQLASLYRGEPAMVELVLPVMRLMKSAVTEYEEIFDDAEAELADVIDLLRNVRSRKGILNQIRNDLYRRIMAWDEMVEDWTRIRPRPGAKVEALLRKTYRFLAPRFMQRDEWVLMSKLIDNPDAQDEETVVAWYINDEEV